MIKTSAILAVALVAGAALFLTMAPSGGPSAFGGPSSYIVPEGAVTWSNSWSTGVNGTAWAAQLLSPRSAGTVDAKVGTSGLQDPPTTFVLDAATISITHSVNGAVVLDGSWTSPKATLQGQLNGVHTFLIHAPAVKIPGPGTYLVSAWFSMHTERGGVTGNQAVNAQQVFSIIVS